MTIQQLYDALEARIPRSLSCGWDNDGLSCCPDPAAPVRGVLVALDATEDAVAAAERRGCNTIPCSSGVCAPWTVPTHPPGRCFA